MGGVSTSHARLTTTVSRRSFPPAVRPMSAMSSPVSVIDRTLISYPSNVANSMSRHPIRGHAFLLQRAPHYRRDATVEVVDTVNGRVSQINVDDDRTPHLRLRHDVLALAALGNADDPTPWRRRDVATGRKRLHRRGRLEPGEPDFEPSRHVPEGLGRLLNRVDIFGARQRLFPGEVAKFFLRVGQGFDVHLEPEEEVCRPLKELQRPHP